MVIFTRKETKSAIILKIVLAHLKNTSEIVAKITDQAVRGSFRKRLNFRFIYFFLSQFYKQLTAHRTKSVPVCFSFLLVFYFINSFVDL